MGLEGVFRRNQIRKEIMLFAKIYKDFHCVYEEQILTDIGASSSQIQAAYLFP